MNFEDSNCQIPNSNLTGCLLCYKGFYYNTTQSRCTVGVYNCLMFNVNGTCQICPPGYYLDTNLNCSMIDPECKTFNAQTKTCITCYLGYALNQNLTCTQLSLLPASITKYFDNCSQFDQTNKCISCYWGFYLTSDTTGPYCSQVSPYCRTYNASNGECTSCYFGYYLSVSGGCIRFM